MDVTSHFEASRDHLRQVAYRMLGSRAEADDAVQETWLRLQRSDTSAVANLTGWLTTVIARVCLDMLRKRREAPLEQAPAQSFDPREDAQLAESVGLAMMIVLQTLDPAERLAFVLHDLFAVPFDEIAEILGKSSDATRQLASRARRRVRGAPIDETKLPEQRATVERFIAALRARDVDALLAVLDPEVEARAGGRVIKGAEKWARSAIGYLVGSGQSLAGQEVALVNGAPGIIVAPSGKLERALRFTFDDAGKITAVDILTDATAIEVAAI
jgi:RNA polymerase sigma factor (sigma-70 family)